jgi:hypothetical protein
MYLLQSLQPPMLLYHCPYDPGQHFDHVEKEIPALCRVCDMVTVEMQEFKIRELLSQQISCLA